MAEGTVARQPGFAARYTDAVQRRRDELCFSVWGLGTAVSGWRSVGEADPVAVWESFPRLFAAEWRPEAALAWVCLLCGVGLRFWAAGNLEKNRFDRPVGPYRLVRHPLYLGTLLVSLSFLLSIGRFLDGAVLWVVLLLAVFLPVLRKEERELRERFPSAYGRYLRTVPALLPLLREVPASLQTDCFTLDRARRNFGLRALWFLLIVPLANVVFERWLWWRWHL